MPAFEVPFSSSPPDPSTPESNTKIRNRFAPLLLPSHPSTTPAGPPPSSVGSFTPADPPPPSLLDSSPLGSSRPFSKQNGHLKHPHSSSKKSNRLKQPSRKSGQARDSTQSQGSAYSGLGSPNPALTAGEYGRPFAGSSFSVSSFGSRQGDDDTSLLTEPDWQGSILRSPFPRPLLNSPKRTKRKLETYTADVAGPPDQTVSMGPVPDSEITAIAADMARRTGGTKHSESNELILATEKEIDKFNRLSSHEPQSMLSEQIGLLHTTEKISRLWHSEYLRLRKTGPASNKSPSVGAGAEASPMENAIVVALLMVRIHHLPTADGAQAYALQTSSNLPVVRQKAFSETLKDWLEEYHHPWSTICEEVVHKHPSPPDHFNYWDTVFLLTLRGRLNDTIDILDRSDFKSAETAPRDGYHDGYTETQIQNIHMVTARVAELLRTSPAVVDGDWNVTGNDWCIFRRQVEGALDELINFVEDSDHVSNVRLSAFASQRPNDSIAAEYDGRNVRRGESRIPWTPYQSLRSLFGILLGRETEILSSAQDWIEATVGLTIWWTGDDGVKGSTLNLGVSKYALKEARSKGQRLVDLDSEVAYLNRLAFSFRRTTDNGDDENFQLNSNNPLEVAVASVFENNFQGVMGLLRVWSLMVASTVAEIATLGGWFSFNPASSDRISSQLDEGDLMVLSSYGQPEYTLRRDNIMIEYASALLDKGVLQVQRQPQADGWKLAIPVLQRINDSEIARQEISKTLLKLNISSSETMNDILDICSDCNITELGMKLSERYADTIAESSDDYGNALVFYARAHCHQRIKNVLDLLLSISLMRSEAYPPIGSLDQALENLLYNPVITFDDLGHSDAEAASSLHRALTGYAALRKFYDLRDKKPLSVLQESATHSRDPMMEEAARTLLAVIQSASGSISGGLYDAKHEAVVQFDGLLALIGEALVFVNQEHQVLTPDQSLVIVRAIEDLQAVPRHIFEQSEAFLRSVLASHRGGSFSESPRKLLKTMSSMASGSSFSLVSSSLLESLSSNSTDQAMSDSDTLPKVEKGWDWRDGMQERSGAEDLLRMIRLGLARSLARSWIDDGDR